MWRCVALVGTKVSEEFQQFLRLVIPYVFPSLLILSTLMMEQILSSETSVPTTATRLHIPVDDILHSRRQESLNIRI
jgi:hypothetical protein